MSEYTKAIVDATTGEVTVVPLSGEEIDILNKRKEEYEAQRALNAAKKQEEIATKLSAIEKLKSIGLTEEEAKALIW